MSLWTDLLYSVRSLARTPLLTSALLLTIALGIGSNATIAGVVNGLFTSRLPLAEADRAVVLVAAADSNGPAALDADRYLSLRGRSDLFERLGTVTESRAMVTLEGRSSVMSVAAISPDVAAILNLAGSDGVIVSHALWSTILKQRDDFRGMPVVVDRISSRIAGVAPDWLAGVYDDRAIDVWMPQEEPGLDGSAGRVETVLARLRPGVSAASAASALRNPGDDATALRPAAGGATEIEVHPYTGTEVTAAAGLARMKTLLAIAAAGVFIVACGNVGAFLLSRAASRARETSVRVALGASRAQLARHVLADAIVIAIGGGALGALLATWTAGALPALFFSEDAERLVFAPDGSGIALAVGVCAVVIGGCAMLPLLAMRHDDPAAVLRRESAGPSVGIHRLKTGMVILQMTCCCLLVVSALQLVAGFRGALRTGLGTRLRSSVLATVESTHRFARPDLGFAYFAALEATARAMPGVEVTAFADAMPGTRSAWQPMRFEPPAAPTRAVTLDAAEFTAETFKSLVMPPRAGRMFGGGDSRHRCPVVVLSERAAAATDPDGAIGRELVDPAGQRVQVIGVVAVRPGAADAQDEPTVYYYGDQAGILRPAPGPARFAVPDPSQTTPGTLHVNVVSAGYFAAMDLEPTAGAVFRDEPSALDCGVGVINEAAANLYFPAGAIGGAAIDASGRRTTIVGVVRPPVLQAAQRRPEPTIYLPLSQNFLWRMTLVAAGTGDQRELTSSIERRLAAVEGGEVKRVTTLEDHLARTALAGERMASTLVGADAAIALALGGLGLAGAMSDAARRRRREFAIRTALGSPAWRIMRQVFGEGARLAGTGAGLGLLGSVIVSRWLTRWTPDAATPAIQGWLTAAVLLLVSVGIACIVPARRAATVDPLAAMRDE